MNWREKHHSVMDDKANRRDVLTSIDYDLQIQNHIRERSRKKAVKIDVAHPNSQNKIESKRQREYRRSMKCSRQWNKI